MAHILVLLLVLNPGLSPKCTIKMRGLRKEVRLLQREEAPVKLAALHSSGALFTLTHEVATMFLTRRQFLKTTAGIIAGVAIADEGLALIDLQRGTQGGDPLGA